MSVLDRLAFWRKHDEFDADLPPDLGTAPPQDVLGTGGVGGLPPLSGGLETEKVSYTQPLGFERPSATPSPTGSPSRDLEIISLKLDAIKAELDAVNQRLVRVEKLVELNARGKTPRDVWATY